MQNCVAAWMCCFVTTAGNIRSTQTFLLVYSCARKWDLHLQKSLREVGFVGTWGFLVVFCLAVGLETDADATQQLCTYWKCDWIHLYLRKTVLTGCYPVSCYSLILFSKILHRAWIHVCYVIINKSKLHMPRIMSKKPFCAFISYFFSY